MTDRNLLFGVFVLQADLIDVRQFIEIVKLPVREGWGGLSERRAFSGCDRAESLNFHDGSA